MAPGAHPTDTGGAADALGRPGESPANRAMMDRIASPFDETRREPWAPVVAFLDQLGPGLRVLDLAGGNGRHSAAASEKGLRPVLVDISRNLLRIARKRAGGSGGRWPAVAADAGSLPFRDDVFDAALFIAGVHCIRGRHQRVRALSEMRRVVRRDGHALVTVWSSEQERFRDIVSGQRRAEATDALTTDAEVGDVIVPWSKGLEEPVERFFHVYSEGELRRELEDAGLRVERIDAVTLTRGPVPDNWFATVRC